MQLSQECVCMTVSGQCLIGLFVNTSSFFVLLTEPDSLVLKQYSVVFNCSVLVDGQYFRPSSE